MKVYTNGLYEVIPNPLDMKTAKSVQETYNKGMLISYKVVRLPRKFFDNSDNFNA